MLKNGEVEFSAPPDYKESREIFKYILAKKQKMTTSDLISGIDDSGSLQVFFDQIFALKYEETPDYQNLKLHLS